MRRTMNSTMPSSRSPNDKSRYSASADVLHGLHVPGTNIGTEVVPGYVSQVRTTIRFESVAEVGTRMDALLLITSVTPAAPAPRASKPARPATVERPQPVSKSFLLATACRSTT